MIIALNNKSNLEKNRFREYQKELSTINTFNKMIVCPTFLNISNYNLNNFSLGAQNVSINDNGAYTGEISASQLKSFGVEYAIVGHSERRQYQKETNDEINKKVNNLLENDIIPILCIGETREERESGKVKEVLIKELLTAVENVNDEDKEKIIIAYEPIWAIGTGKTATKEDANSTIMQIRKKIAEMYGQNEANGVIIQYGGSVKSANAKELFEMSDIDGGLVGGASLKADEFAKIVNY